MMLLKTASDELLESSDGGSQRRVRTSGDEIDVKKLQAVLAHESRRAFSLRCEIF